MAVTLHHLSNGVPVIIDHENHTESASVGMYFKVGSRFETANTNGVAHFLEHMAFQGTSKRTALELAEQMEDLGAEQGAFTDKDHTCYYMNGLGTDAVKFCELLADIVCDSILPPKNIDLQRETILEEIAMHKDDAGSYAGSLAWETAYPAQPYGAEILGPKENVQAMGRAALKMFKDEHYHAGNLIVSIAGNVDIPAVLAELESTVGRLHARPASVPVPAIYAGGASHKERKTEQIQLRMVFNGCAATDPRGTAQALMTVILGGGMSSRLFQKVREERGLAYDVGAGASYVQDAGEVIVWVGTGKDKISAVTPIICDEINNIRREKVTQAEMARAKKIFLVGMAEAQDLMESRMMGQVQSFHYKGCILSLQERQDKINSVTADDIRAVANDVFSSIPTVATVGSRKNIESYASIVKRLKL